MNVPVSTRLSPALALSALFILTVSLNACAPAKSPADMNAMSFNTFAFLEGADAAHATTSCGTICQNRRQEFRYVVYVGKQIYCYWDRKRADTGTDFDALANQIESSITDDSTTTDYYLAARKWASAFHDGHVNMLMKTDTSDIEIYSAPIRMELLAPGTNHEKLVISEATAGFGANVGDEVTMIGDKTAKEAVDASELMTSGSTARMRRFFGARRLVDGYGISQSLPLKLTLNHLGSVRLAEIPRSVTLASHPVPGTGAGADTTGLATIQAKVLPGNLGYLRADGFGGSQGAFLLGQAMDRLSQTRGLILDMRKNGGGDQSGDSIIGRLITKTVTRYQVSERVSDYLLASRPELFNSAWNTGGEFTDWHSLEVKPIGTAYGKPVYVLTSPNCFSACDTFVAALKSNHLATVVGEGSGGGTGSPLVFDLPVSGFQFRYGVVRGKTSTDDWIEGSGTQPDVAVEVTQAERMNGVDQQLLTAASMLLTQLNPADPNVQPVVEGIRSWASTQTPVYRQSLDIAPTIQDEIDLRKIVTMDELGKAN